MEINMNLKTFKKTRLVLLIELYSDKLIKDGIVTKEEVNAVIDKYEKICEEAFHKAAEETQVFHKHWLDSPWSGFFEGKDPLKVEDTGIHEETLVHIGKRFAQGPPNAPDFKVHRAMERILKVISYFASAAGSGFGRIPVSCAEKRIQLAIKVNYR